MANKYTLPAALAERGREHRALLRREKASTVAPAHKDCSKRVAEMRAREARVEARMGKFEPNDPEHRRLERLIVNARKARKKLERRERE